ncbi:MAG: SDR family NAD(P)-dependent oxidoreductase [Muribaculaceae bacterium]|nr:SDR family NAD(P)-dependent oxidoreductase [Muribaculaceae bacterium]
MKPQIKDAFIITGATGSIGQEIALALARTKKPIILACRNQQKAEALKARIIDETSNKNIFFIPLLLEDKDSIANFAKRLAEDEISVYALVNNAGVMKRRYETNKDGQEMTFAVNYIGTLLFTFAVMPFIVKNGHIVFTTSVTRRLYMPSSIELNENRERFTQLGTYGRSKSALTHFAMSMANCYKDYRINCVDPGIVDSNMITMRRWYDPVADVIFRPFINSPRNGAIPALKAITLKSSGNIITRRLVRPIPYDMYDVAHNHLIASTRDLLLALGADI